METTRATTTHSRRLLAQIAVAAALALLLGGHFAAPAGAENNDRQSAIGKANDFISSCFANGGEPDAETQDNIDVDGYGFVGASCSYDNGQTDYCNYNYDGTQDCWSEMGLTRPPSGPGAAGITTVYGGADTGAASGGQPAASGTGGTLMQIGQIVPADQTPTP